MLDRGLTRRAMQSACAALSFAAPEHAMSRGDKSSYTDKQKRQAEHIEESEREAGRSKDDAERIAWATVNKQDGGGKKSGSGRKGNDG